jgi:glycolate oxidase FAD binding subunit
VGGVRDYVLGATLLNGRGEVLSFGGQVMKNVAGYDVSRLLAGSMGVLGVICEVSLKVLPQCRWPRHAALRAGRGQALRKLNEWGGQPLPLNASAWWDGTLVLRLAGAAAAVQSALRAGRRGDRPGAGRQVSGPACATTRDEFFAGAAKAVEAGATLWRLSVPQTAPPLKLPGEQLSNGAARSAGCAPAAGGAGARGRGRGQGGHAVLFRGATSRAGVFAPLSPPLARIHRELKAAFDPDGVFNPGRLYPEI